MLHLGKRNQKHFPSINIPLNSFIRQNGCNSLIEKQYGHVDKEREPNSI